MRKLIQKLSIKNPCSYKWDVVAQIKRQSIMINDLESERKSKYDQMLGTNKMIIF